MSEHSNLVSSYHGNELQSFHGKSSRWLLLTMINGSVPVTMKDGIGVLAIRKGNDRVRSDRGQ